MILSGTACMVAGALALAVPSIAFADVPAPPADNGQNPGAPPSSGQVWMAGHWNSEGGQWRWQAGHWELPPSRSAVWVPGHWIQGGSGWVWVNGAWNVAEAPQSADAPPQPPGAPQMQNGQGVPMPSSPAPNVAGAYQGQYQYGPQYAQAVQPVADTTYYPPVDYSVAYPGYYWDGAAWAWGFYPGFGIGLGWWGGPGWGYYGRGWGYGHGGWHGAGAGAVGHVRAGAGHAGGGHYR